MGKWVRSNTSEFVTKAKMIHGDKYNYDEVEYQTAKHRINIRCNIHGLFSQSPNDHLNGYGCPDCGGSKRLTNDKFDTKLLQAQKQVRRIGNYVNAHTHILVECLDCKHQWTAMPTKLTGAAATGCPRCRTEKGVFGKYSEYDGITFRSILERDCYIVVESYCQEHGFDFEVQKKYSQSTTNHTCDFYIPDLQLWIEVSGIKTDNYNKRLQQKVKWVAEINENFLFGQNPKQLKEILYGKV